MPSSPPSPGWRAAGSGVRRRSARRARSGPAGRGRRQGVPGVEQATADACGRAGVETGKHPGMISSHRAILSGMTGIYIARTRRTPCWNATRWRC
ncbi:hypothetical protein HBB16_16595 [Pseudonocardia sp. MCCB 268]|nr:hypothetical protein [Pseudonocardia cytotoxica]